MQATSTWTAFEPIIGLLLIATTITFCLQINKIKNLELCHFNYRVIVFTWITMLLVVPQVKNTVSEQPSNFTKVKGEK